MTIGEEIFRVLVNSLSFRGYHIFVNYSANYRR
jgi:hypothetical protein